MDSKPVSLCVGTQRHRIQPVARLLCLGTHSYSIRQVLNRKGGLIIGEGDTGKSTYAQMLFEAAAKGGDRAPILVKLRTRPTNLTLPDVPKGETQTIIWDGLDEFPECARDIVDKTIDLDPERYHIWVTSRSGNAASVVATSPLLQDVYHLKAFSSKDIMSIAKSVQLDGKSFLEAIDAKRLWPFMGKPGGAVILMQLFANGKLGTGSRIDLMETIMLDFARETRDGDAECNPKLAYPLHQIIEATCWIAACLVLTGKSAIWTGAKSACPANDIFIEDIPSHGFDPAIFRAALGLRLFEPLTGERYRLAYSDMPAFLAGRWLAKHFPVDRIEDIPPPQPFLDDEEDDEDLMVHHATRIDAIAWASVYDPAFGKPFILDYPDAFFGAHALIAEVGIPQYVKALLEDQRYANSDSELLDGFDAFYDYLGKCLDSGTCSAAMHEMITFLTTDDARHPDWESFDEPDDEPAIEIPTDREVTQRLKRPIDVREMRELFAAEKARGLPYAALRKFFDIVVFNLQKDDEQLANPTLAGCALSYDTKRYLATIVQRLPPEPRDVPITEIYKSHVEYFEAEKKALEAWEKADPEELEEPTEEEIVSASVCKAVVTADKMGHLRLYDSQLDLETLLRLLHALRTYGGKGSGDVRGDVVAEIESRDLDDSGEAQEEENDACPPFTPADLEALCAPPPTPPPLTREDMETILRKQVTEIKSHITAEANREPNALATQSNQPERTTKIAPPDFSDLSSCKEFCHGLYTEIRGKMKDKVHSEIQAVQYILHGAKPGDLYYDDCAVARKIQKERNWERTTFATYCKQKVAPKRRTIKRAAKKHATQKKVRRDLRGL